MPNGHLYNFCHFNYICLGIDFFGFFLFGTLCGSWAWISISYSRPQEIFLAIVSSNTCSAPFSLSSPSGTPMMGMLLHMMFSQWSLKLSSFFKFFFSFAIILFPRFSLLGRLCVLLYHLICYWFPLMYFSTTHTHTHTHRLGSLEHLVPMLRTSPLAALQAFGFTTFFLSMRPVRLRMVHC